MTDPTSLESMIDLISPDGQVIEPGFDPDALLAPAPEFEVGPEAVIIEGTVIPEGSEEYAAEVTTSEMTFTMGVIATDEDDARTKVEEYVAELGQTLRSAEITSMEEAERRIQAAQDAAEQAAADARTKEIQAEVQRQVAEALAALGAKPQ